MNLSFSQHQWHSWWRSKTPPNSTRARYWRWRDKNPPNCVSCARWSACWDCPLPSSAGSAVHSTQASVSPMRHGWRRSRCTAGNTRKIRPCPPLGSCIECTSLTHLWSLGRKLLFWSFTFMHLFIFLIIFYFYFYLTYNYLKKYSCLALRLRGNICTMLMVIF